MVALINLIFVAHPIIARHGGKIMTHLLMVVASITPSITCEIKNEAGYSNIGSLTNDAIKNMAVLIAAIILVLEDNNFASELLVSIGNHHGEFQQKLVFAVSTVREVASSLERIFAL